MSLELVDGPDYASYSQLTTFASCGKQYQLGRIFKLPEKPAWYLCGGTAVHTASEEYDQREGEPRELTTLDATDLFARHFQKAVDEAAGRTSVPLHEWRAGGRRSKAYPNKEDAGWWIDHGPGMVVAYSQWRSATQWPIWRAPGDLAAIELTLLANFGSVPVKMGIDRVFVFPTGEPLIVDLKTGSREPDSNLQLGFYASGMEAVLGVRPLWGAYYMARTNRLTDAAGLDSYSLPVLTAELELFFRAKQEGIFLPRRGSHCISCGQRDNCAAVGGVNAALYDPAHPDYGKASA